MEASQGGRSTNNSEGDHMQREEDPPVCDAVPGTRVCAERNWNKHCGKPEGCQGRDECVSRYKDDPQARNESADAFRLSPANVLRFMAHEASEARKRISLMGSTGQGFGHLADAHAMGRSAVPMMVHRFPKTIA